MNARSSARWILLLASLFIAAGCASTRTTPAVSHKASASQTVESPSPQSGSATQDRGLVPAQAAIRQDLDADLDDDGRPEHVVAYEIDGEVRIAIGVRREDDGGPWSVALPAGSVFGSLYAKDLNADHHPEVLVEFTGPESNAFGLGVVGWSRGSGTFLGPHSKAEAVEDFYFSSYYPPSVADLDGDTIYDIVVPRDNGDPKFLDNCVYAWNGQEFARTEMYILRPRFRPTASPP